MLASMAKRYSLNVTRATPRPPASGNRSLLRLPAREIYPSSISTSVPCALTSSTEHDAERNKTVGSGRQRRAGRHTASLVANHATGPTQPPLENNALWPSMDQDFSGREWTVDESGELLLVKRPRGDSMPGTVVSASFSVRDVHAHTDGAGGHPARGLGAEDDENMRAGTSGTEDVGLSSSAGRRRSSAVSRR